MPKIKLMAKFKLIPSPLPKILSDNFRAVRISSINLFTSGDNFEVLTEKINTEFWY